MYLYVFYLNKMYLTISPSHHFAKFLHMQNKTKYVPICPYETINKLL